MFAIAVPLALAELGWMAMGLVDTIMVGRLPDSAVAIAATSVGSAAFYAFAIFGLGLFSGLDPLVSQAFGATDLPAARRHMATALRLACFAAPCIMLLVMGAIPMLKVIGVGGAVDEQAVGFAHVLIWSLPPLLLYTVFRRYLQGVHHVRPITFVLVTANLVNIAGNWALIYGHWGFSAMGIKGSALSTVVARIYLVGALFLAIRSRDPEAFQDLRSSTREVLSLFRIGLPAAMTIGFEVGVFNVATALAGTLDPVSTAAHTIALNAATIAYMVPLGIGAAAAVSVGRALGAGDRPGASRAGWIALGIGGGYEVFSAMAFVFLAKQIAGVYSADSRVLSLSVTLLTIAAVFQIFDGLQTAASGALRGAGRTVPAMVWNLLGYWGVGLPVGYWFCFHLGWGAVGLWDGLCVALILIGCGLVWEWRKEFN